MRRTTPKIIIGAIAATALLAGCSGPTGPVAPTQTGSDLSENTPAPPIAPAEVQDDVSGDDSVIYEFTREPPGMVKELTVAIPQDLKTAAAADAEGLLVDRVTLRQHVLSGVKYCAVEFAIGWTIPDPAELDVPSLTQADIDAFVKQWTDSFLSYFNVETADEWRALSDQALGGDEAAGRRLAEGLQAADRNHPYAGIANRQMQEEGQTDPNIFWAKMTELILEDAKKPVDDAGEVSSEGNVGREGLDRAAAPLADLSDSDPQTGLYLSPDYSKGVNVTRCAAHPTDDKAKGQFHFVVRSGQDKRTFATFDYTILTDGSITVVKADVKDYQRDFNQNWIAK